MKKILLIVICIIFIGHLSAKNRYRGINNTTVSEKKQEKSAGQTNEKKSEKNEQPVKEQKKVEKTNTEDKKIKNIFYQKEEKRDAINEDVNSKNNKTIEGLQNQVKTLKQQIDDLREQADMNYAMNLEALQEYQMAIKEYIKIYQDHKTYSALAIYRAAKLYKEKLSDDDNTINLLKILNRDYPEFKQMKQVYAMLADSYGKIKQYSKSVYFLKRLIARYPGSVETESALYEMGESLMKLKKYSEAIDAFITLESNFKDGKLVDAAVYKIANANKAAGDMPQSILYYNKLINKYKNSDLREFALYELALIYLESKQINNFNDTANKYLEEYPTGIYRVKINELIKSIKETNK